MSETICKVCGCALDDHFVVLRSGTAHTGVNIDNRPRFCSEEEAERQHLMGRIGALQTIIRSLRNRAGRLHNRGQFWTPEHLGIYADNLAKDRERLIGFEQRYYPWKKS